ncbi:hypothetical protein XarbCFBP8138_16805 [Xanthomonas arboricola]|nr:hypothetical protein XarbCFBP8138_16805 [Xanthomonas arboricola]
MYGALTACGTRRESVHGGSVAASMPPHGPASGEGTAPDSWSAVFLKACCSAWAEEKLVGHVLKPVDYLACNEKAVRSQSDPE